MLHELVVAREAVQLVWRDPRKYGTVALGMYALSYYGVEMADTFRSAYYVVRGIDDVLDGDRKITGDPVAYAQDLKYQIESDRFNDSFGLSQLAKRAIRNLEKKSGPEDNPRKDFTNAIDEIVFDHQRAKERRVLTHEEIEAYYLRAFNPVINLMLLGIDSAWRSKDMPVMSYGQGRVYSADDLSVDWPRGVLNIPGEQLALAGLSADSPVDAVIKAPQVNNYFKRLLSQTKPELVTLQQRLKGSDEKLTSILCGGLIKPMIMSIDRYQQSSLG